MLRYFYSVAPLVISGSVVLLALPWLGLIALMVFALVGFAALVALAWAIVFVPYTLGRTISRRLHPGRGHRPSTAQPLAERRNAEA